MESLIEMPVSEPSLRMPRFGSSSVSTGIFGPIENSEFLEALANRRL